jgi:hypothetical protein
MQKAAPPSPPPPPPRSALDREIEDLLTRFPQAAAVTSSSSAPSSGAAGGAEAAAAAAAIAAAAATAERRVAATAAALAPPSSSSPSPSATVLPSLSPYNRVQGEVIEVKNVCPFQMVEKRSGRGVRRVYQLSDRGPHSHVPVHYVPQLMMEILATGAPSALFVTRTPLGGIRTFRLPRDDVYIAEMLEVISRFYTMYVLRRREPPENFFIEWALYRRFLVRTKEVAAAAVLLHHEVSPRLPRGRRRDVAFLG